MAQMLVCRTQLHLQLLLSGFDLLEIDGEGGGFLLMTFLLQRRKVFLLTLPATIRFLKNQLGDLCSDLILSSYAHT